MHLIWLLFCQSHALWEWRVGERERWKLIWDLGLLKRFLCEGPVAGDVEEEMTREVGDGWGGLAQRKALQAVCVGFPYPIH